MVDLDDIRRTLIACRDVPWSCACITPQELEALVEEVERLRDAECLADARVAEMHDVAMLRERDSVVAWLRTLDDRWGLGASVCGAAADDIERGEHRRTEEEP